jgi:hypothetical protein
MPLSRSLCFLFVISLLAVAGSQRQPDQNSTRGPLCDHRVRFPVVEEQEAEPADPVKLAKLKKLKQQYDKDAPFGGRPSPRDTEVSFLPEFQFDFGGLPVAQSDAIVVGEVLSAAAHRSENKGSVFSNFEVRVDEVLKGGGLNSGLVINVQRLGGIVKYADGQSVLFTLSATGMPVVGLRYALFLKAVGEDYSIVTGYEFAPGGLRALDCQSQFLVYEGDKEIDFMLNLRNAVSKAASQPQ